MQRLVILSDVHAPYHDRKAFALVMQAVRAFKPNILLLLGDFVDCYAISDYDRDPTRMLRFDGEIREANKILDQLDTLKTVRKVFIAGNHENRLDRYLARKAPELHSYIDISTLLRLKTRRWDYVPYKDFVRVGACMFTHDLDSDGAGAVRKALSDAQHSISIGHTHRLGYIVEGGATGKAKVAASFGWLGDASKADYKHRLKANRDWALGFGIGYLRPNGIVHLVPVPIVNYSCVVEGRLYAR